MNKTSVLLVSTTVALGSCSLYLVQTLRIERDRVAVLQARVTELERALQMAKTQAVQPSIAAATPDSPQDAPAPTQQSIESLPSKSRTVVTNATKNRAADAKDFRQRLTDPRYQAAQLVHLRLALERKYPDLAAALNLQPDEADRFLDLLAKQELREREYEMKVNDDGRLRDEAAFRERQRQNEEHRRTVEAERAALLGEAKLHEWTQYVNSLGARAQMQELRTMLAASSYPLRDDQFAPLVASLAAEEERHTAERDKLYNDQRNSTNATAEEVIQYMGRRLDLIEQSLQRRREAAAMYLGSEQQKRYDTMLDRERKSARNDYDLFVALAKETSPDP